MLWPILRNAFSTPVSMTGWTIKIVSWTTLTIQLGSQSGLSQDMLPWCRKRDEIIASWNMCLPTHRIEPIQFQESSVPSTADHTKADVPRTTLGW